MKKCGRNEPCFVSGGKNCVHLGLANIKRLPKEVFFFDCFVCRKDGKQVARYVTHGELNKS